ncbi:MAG TPA: Zn-dependent alcohol dehydrogenase [Steroidobacter sp.]|nr:Zn-dependent alcohol dehydrogenase [Steroidobacteraceae bacterium]HLS82453.1 Zn-dependent alcohol dehydrogenase [Steroidobacter sp.]
MKALIALELNRLAVEDISIAPPKTGEVLIRMKAAGVCHSDLSVANGTVPMPLPMVLGHEGAGVVAEVGPGVTNVKPGDHVVLSFVPACGECWFCVRKEPHLCVRCDPRGRMLDGTSRLQLRGQELGAMSQLGCLAEYAVVPAMSVMPIDRSIPFAGAALVGCAVMTGVGAVANTARVEAGATVAVFGCGGVGLAAIQGARLVGARQIIAVDLADHKLEYARRFGATDCVNAGEDPVAAVKALTGGWGVDYSFEMTGRAAVMEQAYAAARRGGSVCIVGLGRYTESMRLNALLLAGESKRILGCFYGSANFRVDMPNLLALYQAKRLDLDGLITKTYGIEQAPSAFDDLEAGRNARGLILFD